LNGTARKPGIQMSFHQYDFGPCFVTRQPMSIKAVLELVNNDDAAISIETNFEKKPYLDVQLSPGEVLLPSTKEKEEKLQIPIIFTPRDIMSYHEVVTLDFNGIYKIDVIIKGEGIPMNIELVDPDQHIVDFGIVSKASDITKTVNLINKSRKPITFCLRGAIPEDLIKSALTITPSEEITLKPKKVLPIEVRFNPKARMPDFTHDILLDIKGNEARKLFTVKGVSHGIELKLMEEVVGFGSVIKGSRLTKQLQLANFGDIRAKFKWDTKAYSKNFTIFPESGYIPPHEDIYLEITFHPNRVDDDICAKNIKCEYTGGSSLSLTLMGKCIAQDKEATKEIHFETVVRKATTQNVSINNPTEKEWRIKPTISTNVDSIKEYFRGSEILVVPPKGNAEYQVTYIPLTMTKQKEVAKENEEKETITIYHEASLFFPLPDGKAEFYNLFGKSNKPDVSGTFEEHVQAKKPKYINIPVENWLKTAQRFKVTTEMEEEQKDETTFIRGANTFDVAANSTKDYKLNFLTYKAGGTNFKVKFLNEQTGEYMFFNVKVVAEEPGLQSSIELACPVRETASKMIIIENPTSKEITVKREEFAIANEYIEIAPASITIPPQSERGFEISYRPLIVSEEKEDLVLNSAALGTYKYELVLKGLVSTAQRSLHFNCTLGSELVQQFTVKHYLKKATNYAVKAEDMVGHPSTCFKIEQQSVQALAAENNNGVNISVNVRFEPNIIGEIRAILKLTSPENIEYTCMLYGHSTAPQPQGPFKIGGGKGEKGGKGPSSVSIEFKNPLAEKAQFIATFDNPTFMLSSKMPDFLEPGKSIQLQVTRVSFLLL
jgi:hydrocephalus-inducing protein